MKRLFMVGDASFADKIQAKLYRGANGPAIKLGPDHWRYGLKKKPGTTHTNHGDVGTGFRKWGR